VDATPGTSSAGGECPGISWALRSHPGRVRADNEDFVGAYAPQECIENGAAFVVADGMGGHAAGEVASRIAVETVLRSWVGSDATRPAQSLRAAARAANTAVFAASMDLERRGMGTTLVSLVLAAGEAFVVNVGDSRAYHVRKGVCSQLTVDHSRVGEMLRMRLITPEQAAHHPARSQLTRSLGGEPAVQVDLVRQDLAAGDAFVLCSDGLWDLVSRKEIADAVAGGTSEAAESMIATVLDRGAPDNVTAVVVRVVEGYPIAAARPGGLASLLGRMRR
jgi:serine/threonine protein phosphatase PrpC